MKNLLVLSLLFVSHVTFGSDALTSLAISAADQNTDRPFGDVEGLLGINEPNDDYLTPEDLKEWKKTLCNSDINMSTRSTGNTRTAVLHGDNYMSLTVIVPIIPNNS